MKKILLAFFLLSFITSSQFYQLFQLNNTSQGNAYASESLNNLGSKIQDENNEPANSSINFANLMFSMAENITPVGNEVIVPINVANLVDIGAVSLRIQYNISAMTFTGVSNQPAAGNFTSGSSGNTITLGWFNTSPLVVTGGKFVDLHFSYSSGSSPLTFVTAQCEIANLIGDVISPVDYENGSVIGGVEDTSKIVSLGVDVAPAGLSVIMPVNIKNLTNAGAISLKIQFDTSVLTFVNISNPPATGNIAANAADGVVTIGWFNTSPLGIDSGKFVDIHFTYKSGSSDLSFLTSQCEITDVLGNPISSIIYLNGSVAANEAPHFTSVMPDTVINQNQELKFQFTAEDPNPGTVLKYSLAKKPEGAIIDSLTGEFSWTPAYNQSGDFEVSAVVSDGGLSDTSAVSTIRVQVVNLPPQFTSVLSDTTIHQMQTLTFQYEASDPNGAKRARLNATTLKFFPVSVPEGASLDSLTGIFSWTPTYKQLGNFNIIVSVSDGELTAVDTAVVTVLKTNVAPYFTEIPIGDTLHANRTYTFQLKADDPNGDPVTFSLGGNPPSGASITASEFKWIISLDQVGTHNIVFRVSDGTLNKDTTITVHVGTAVGVEKEFGKTPDSYGLKQNYPNPFNPTTIIRYQIPTSEFVSIKIYNILGKEVSTLVNENKSAGEYSIKFDANNLQSGFYIYQLKAGNFSEVRKMLLIK